MIDRTKALLAILYRDYWATEEKKKEIIAKEQEELRQIELEKAQKYDVNNIFKGDKEPKEIVEESKMLAVVEKETIFKKILNFFKRNF